MSITLGGYVSPHTPGRPRSASGVPAEFGGALSIAPLSIPNVAYKRLDGIRSKVWNGPRDV